MEDAVLEDASLKDKTKQDKLKHAVTFEGLSNLNYLNQVVLEALRFNPPVLHSSYISLNQDSQIGNYKFKAGDNICCNFEALHKNKNEWQKPREFLPERFDHENELSLTPQGKKRNTYSWLPFNGGTPNLR